jgi:hypothetical protein
VTSIFLGLIDSFLLPACRRARETKVLGARTDDVVPFVTTSVKINIACDFPHSRLDPSYPHQRRGGHPR